VNRKKEYMWNSRPSHIQITEGVYSTVEHTDTRDTTGELTKLENLQENSEIRDMLVSGLWKSLLCLINYHDMKT
jgi:hypothetical protein